MRHPQLTQQHLYFYSIFVLTSGRKVVLQIIHSGQQSLRKRQKSLVLVWLGPDRSHQRNQRPVIGRIIGESIRSLRQNLLKNAHIRIVHEHISLAYHHPACNDQSTNYPKISKYWASPWPWTGYSVEPFPCRFQCQRDSSFPPRQYRLNGSGTVRPDCGETEQYDHFLDCF